MLKSCQHGWKKERPTVGTWPWPNKPSFSYLGGSRLARTRDQLFVTMRNIFHFLGKMWMSLPIVHQPCSLYKTITKTGTWYMICVRVTRGLFLYLEAPCFRKLCAFSGWLAYFYVDNKTTNLTEGIFDFVK